MMFLSLLCSSISWAVPLQLTQQGRILDPSGIAVDGSQIVIFRIYDQDIGGTKIWDETLTVQFHNGYYATILGADTTNALDSDVFSLYPVYLELQLNSNSPMTPRQPINSAPYAQISGVAESVNGGKVNASEVNIGTIPVIDANRNWVGQPITIDWSQVQNIPSNITDGDDNTQLSEQDVEYFVSNDPISLHEGTTINGQEILTLGMDSDTLADISCGDGDIPKWNEILTQWECALDSDTLRDLHCSIEEVAKWNGAVWECGQAQDTLSNLNCSAGQVAYFDGSIWSCQNSNVLFDNDNDNIPAWEDCDDNDNTSYARAVDADCDGFLLPEDCDNSDASSYTIYEDGDCDGTLTADDCDDNDKLSTILSEDTDCDGDLDGTDCNDLDEDIYTGASEQCGDGIDQDCDGFDLPCFGGATFTNCSQTGASGPNQSQCNVAYSGTEIDGEVTVNSGVQSWVIPNGVTSLQIEAFGAAGGYNVYCSSFKGGNGARMKGIFSVTPGQVLNVVVGQKGLDGGSNSSNDTGSGGGGTFVWIEGESTPLVVAGGGGAGAICTSGGNSSDAPGMHGVTDQSGTADRRGGSSGGSNGSDGSGSGAGKGWLTVRYSPNGGVDASPNGGFGGGGAVSGTHSGGGGGGYSGGGACPYNGGCGYPASGGGGGGSYNSGSDQNNSAGANTGNGYVTISLPN